MFLCKLTPETLDEIRTRSSIIVEDYYNDRDATPDTFERNVIEYIASFKHNISITDVDAVTEQIILGIVEDGGMEQDTFVNPQNIKSLLEVVANNGDLNLGKEATLDRALKDQQEDTNIVKASLDFLENSYGIATQAKRLAIIEADSCLFDACFINRGRIKGKTGVVSLSQLNNNIRQYQQQLLEKICEYLRTQPQNDFTQEELNAINNPVLYRLNGNKYENTGIYEILDSKINKYLAPNRYKPETIQGLYSRRLTDQNAKLELDAFNATIFFKNFDSYLRYAFKGAIKILKDFGRKTGADKYGIVESTSAMPNNFRTNENVDPSKEVGNIVQTLFNTTQIHNWQGVNTGRYLTFQNYQNVLSKIKALWLNSATKNIVFNQAFKENYPNLWDSFTKSTQDYLEGKTLSEAINYLRKNPVQYLHHIFEVFANKQFKNTFPKVFENFIAEELNHIYTVNKFVFSSDPNSVRNLVGIRPEINYYLYIAQVSDCIFDNKFAQLFRDDNGNLSTRELTDLSKVIDRKKFISDVNAINFAQSTRNQRYNIHLTQSTDINGNSVLGGILFTIPETNITISVDFSTGRCTYSDKNYSQFSTNSKVLEFIDEILGLGVSMDSNFIEVIGTENMASAMERLTSLASNVLAVSYIQETELKGKNKTDTLKRASEIFGNIVTYNNATKTINSIIESKSNKATIEEIVKTRYILKGLATSTQVKDSQSATQSRQSLSRLLGAAGSQVDLIELQPDSATRDLSIFREKGLLLGHYTSSEYFDRKSKKSKKATKFSSGEMITAQIMSNFLPTFSPANEYQLIGNGRTAFIPSVNADKGTIGQLLFDLGIPFNISKFTGIYESDGKPVYKKIIELNPDELKAVICKEFGDVNVRIVLKINEDLAELSGYIQTIYPDAPNLTYVDDFREFNKWCWNNGKDPVKLLQDTLESYNLTHKQNPLEFIDQVHYRTDTEELVAADGNTYTYNKLVANNALLSQVARFSDRVKSLGIDITKYPTYEEFLDAKHREIVESLLKHDVVFDLIKNTPVNNYVKDNFPDWVSPSKKMIFAKVIIAGKPYNIYSKKDLRLIGIETGMSEKTILSTQQLILNPLLQQYNTLNYWLTQSWIYGTVGSFIAHPGKKAKALIKNLKAQLKLKKITQEQYDKQVAIYQEAAMFNEQHKRNVSMTAQMFEFTLNALEGIPENYNVAVIEDIKDLQTILSERDCEIKPYDGATIVHPCIVYLENNSLGENKAGFDKKQFVHFKNGPTASGGIIKTAGFGVTNDRIRRSPDGWGIFAKQMMSHQWVNEDGSPATVYNYRTKRQESIDITTGFDGNPIQYKPIYFAKNGNLFRVISIQNLKNNTYSRTIALVNQDGSDIRILTNEELTAFRISSTTVIDNNYDLWKFFGGETSMTLTEKGLRPSETSIENVVTAMIAIGTPKLNKDGTIYQLNEIQTQEQLWQPLKMSDIHYIATAGAVKQGAANINKNTKYNTDIPLNFQRIKMYQAGIQLDKEHHADDAELSLPTQIISACAALGYTIDKADALYKGLANAAELGTKILFDSAQAYFQNNTKANLKALQEQVLKLVAKNMADSKSDSFARTIAKSIVQAVEENPNISYRDSGLPLSDNAVFAKMISTIASTINRTGIKLKIPGLLAVLSPCHNLYKIYGDRTFDSFYFWSEADKQLVEQYKTTLSSEELTKFEELDNQYQLLDALQWAEKPVFELETVNEIYKINLGRKYTVEYIDGTSEIKFINTPKDLRDLEAEITQNRVAKITEYIKDGRNLGAYNVRFRTETGEYFQLWELDNIYYLQELRELQKNGSEKDFQNWYKNTFGTLPTTNLITTLKYYKKQVQKDLENLSKSVTDKRITFDNLMREYFTLYDAQDTENLIKKGEQIQRWLSRNVQGDLQLDQFGTIEHAKYIRDLIQDQQSITINGRKYNVIKDSIDVQAYEIIMPKIFLNEFGFEEFTDLNTVQKDQYYFVKQYIQNQNTCEGRPKPRNNQFDVELRNTNGKHLYLIDKAHLQGSELRPATREILTNIVDGKIIRYYPDGETEMYELLEGSEIYEDAQGNEVIVVEGQKDIDQYISNLSFDTINLSQNLINYGDYAENLAILLENNKKVSDFITEYITPEDTITSETVLKNFKKLATYDLTVEKFEQYIQNPDKYSTELAKLKSIIRAGQRKHSSFLKSLDIVAARIPSQSLQSFMPMKVVAYDNPNRNSAYVSNLQLLLQGSDLDIDAVSLVSFDIDGNGSLNMWSPYANIETIQTTNASLELPFPTGKQLVTRESSNTREVFNFLDKYKDLFKFVRNRQGELKIRLNINGVHALRQLRELLIDSDNNLRPTADKKFDIAIRLKEKIPQLVLKNPAEVDQIFDKIAEVINNHNTYLNNLPKFKLTRVFNNYIVASLYAVIQDPVNQMQAQTSVDATTGPLKDIAETSDQATAAHTRTPGAFTNIAEAIEENQEGKDCISVSAVGIKSFFALTEYANTILNDTNADQSVLLGKKHLDNLLPYLEKMGSTKTILANIRAKDPSTITNEEVFALLLSIENDEDQALVLSALLSLATDNAKELGLAKLNAGRSMIGAYIYGITIGMDFREISQIMMSETGRIVRDIINENMIQEEPGYGDLARAFSYFKDGPIRHLTKYDKYLSSFEERKNLGGFQTPLNALQQFIHPTWNRWKEKHWLVLFAQNNTVTECLKKLDDLRESYKGVQADIDLYNQLIDFCQKYIIQYKTVKYDTLGQLEALSKGAEEMKILGQIASLNQGIPNDLSGLLGKCELFEYALSPMLEDPNLKDKFFKIDLQKFAFDEKYRQKCIKAYEDIKVSFNILHVASTLPHLLKYVQLLAVADIAYNRTYRYRSLKNIYKRFQDDFGGSKSDIIKGVNNYLGDKIIADWMIDTNQRITIPAGNQLFNPDGILGEEPIKENIIIQLGTDYANASFRRWIEYEVIPNLKKGKLSKEGTSVSNVKKNNFIKYLQNDTRTNTNSGNGSVVYTLPINMLPRTDQERGLLNTYIDSFNELDPYTYNGIPITDLFVLYGLIAHNGKLGESSLMPIFDAYQNRGLLESLHRYEDSLDKSNEALSLDTIVDQDIIPYIASKAGPWGATSLYTWGFNETTNRIELMSKGRKTITVGENTERDPGLANYKWQLANKNLDSNYFPNMNISERIKKYNKEFRIQGKSYQITIDWNRVKNEVRVISLLTSVANDKQRKPPYMITDGFYDVSFTAVVKTTNGITELDFKLIRDMFERYIEEDNSKKCDIVPH